MADFPQTGPKLSEEARRLVIEYILAGGSNEQILTALEAAGHPTVSRQALWNYRRDPEVAQALAESRLEAMQAGYGDYARRMALLNRQIASLDKLLDTNAQHPDLAKNIVRQAHIARLMGEARAVLKEIAGLVGDAPAIKIEVSQEPGRREEAAGLSGRQALTVMHQVYWKFMEYLSRCPPEEVSLVSSLRTLVLYAIGDCMEGGSHGQTTAILAMINSQAEETMDELEQAAQVIEGTFTEGPAEGE